MDAEKYSPAKFTGKESDPFREPDRRWLRVQYLIAHGKLPSRKRDDAIVREVWRFRLAWRKCRDEAGEDRLVRRFSSVADAYFFQLGAKPLKLAELEARLLADESDEAIAARVGGISPAGVRMLHDLFYCVRSSLESPGYILNNVIRCPPSAVVAEDDQATWMRLLGYVEGSQAVDRIIEYFRNPPVVPASLSGLDVGALTKLQEKLSIRDMLLSRSLPHADDSSYWPRMRNLFNRPAGLGGHPSNAFIYRKPVPPIVVR